MAQPTAYNRQTNFQNYQAASPSTPLSGTTMDSEFNAVKITLDAILNNLALIQADDGGLVNEIVGNDELAPSVAIGFNSPTAWLTATDYTADTDIVFTNNIVYICRTTHTSGTFATDLAAVKWELLADFSTSNTIDDGSLANAKLADMAANTFKGRRTSTGVPEDLSASQARALLGLSSGGETDNSLVRFSGTDGTVQGSGVIVDDNNSITIPGNLKLSKGADVASATALTLGVGGNYFDVTGTTTITSIATLGAGTRVVLHFDDALVLAHHATNLVLPSAANITTATGDHAEFVEYAAGTWRCVDYQAADGKALVGVAPADLVGKQVIYIPAGSLEPRVTTAPATSNVVEIATSLIPLRTMDFATDADDHAGIGIFMPPSWDAGTITVRMVWSTLGTQSAGLDGVRWFCRAGSYASDAVLTGALGTAVGPVAQNHSATANDVMITAESAAITVANAAAETWTFFEVYRDVSDAGDDLNIDARLHGFFIFYTSDALTEV